MNPIVNCNDVDEKLCLDEMIDRITTELTVGCSLPYSVPASAIALIIKYAKTWFYKHYDDAVEYNWIALSWEHQHDPRFRGLFPGRELTQDMLRTNRGEVMMPDDVISVIEVYDTWGRSGEAGWGSRHRNYGGDPDFGLDRFLFTNAFNGRIAIAADNMMYWTCTEYFLDQSRQMLEHPLGYNYNRLTKRVRFLGELPKGTVVFKVLTRVPDCALFEDDMFFRYCVAMAKIKLGTILGAFTYTLPGNITVNNDVFASAGQNELQEIKQEIQQERAVDYFYTT